MDAQLKTGFRLGDLVIDAQRRQIASAHGKATVSASLIEVLLVLADNPGQAVAFSQIEQHCAGIRDDKNISLASLFDDLQRVLGDSSTRPRFIELVNENELRMIAPVMPGLPEVQKSFVESVVEETRIPFLVELQRRKVIRVAAAYIVLAWIVIQIADVIVPALNVPNWIVTLTVAIALLGFPVAVIVAWFFEITPKGLQRDYDSSDNLISPKQKIIDAMVLGTLALVSGYLAINILLEVQETRENELYLSEPITLSAAANTIAVLPFVTIGSEVESGYIGDGLAEEILRILSKLRELNVAARTSSFYFKNKDVDLQTIAAKLRVRNILSGSVQKAGDSIRITAELIDAATGFQLWSESYDRKFEDIFDIQSDIAKAVADASKVILSNDSSAVLQQRPTSNLEAYDFYLRGRDYLRQPRTSDVLQNAERLFHRALAFDPGYALANAGLCETHLAIYVRTKSTATVDDAESSCRTALEADDSLSEVHTALGYLYWHTGDFDKAEREFRTAIDKDEKSYEAFAGLADTMTSKNQMDNAKLMLQQLIDLQPGYWRGYAKMGAYYYRQGRDADALPYFRQVTDLTPDNAPGWNNLGASHFMLGNLEGAAKAWQRAIDISPTQSMYANLGIMYYYLDRFEESVEITRKALELAPDDFRIWGRLASAFFEMPGRKAETISATNKAITLAEEIIRVNPNEPEAWREISMFYGFVERDEESLTATRKSLLLSPEDPETHFIAAIVYLLVDDEDESLASIKKALDLGYPARQIETEPKLQSLRNNERFMLLLATS